MSDPEETLRDGFRYFDKDGSGYVEAAELRQALTSLGDCLTDEQAEAFFQTADVNGDGRIDYEGVHNTIM